MRAPRLVILGLCLTACMTAPKSRQEFIAAVDAGKGPTQAEHFSVGRSFQTAVDAVRTYSAQCLNKTIDRTGMVGGQMHTGSGSYVATVTPQGAGRAEFTLRLKQRPQPIGAPVGGVFIMAANLQGSRRGETRVDLWSVTIGFYAKIADRFRDWVKGAARGCPELE